MRTEQEFGVVSWVKCEMWEVRGERRGFAVAPAYI